MDSSLMGNLVGGIALGALTNSISRNDDTASAPGINVPGTIVATLNSVGATKNYMEKYAYYNNYLTSNYGAAQQASDRYMSMKERMPMVFEYYLTPTTRKTVYMYINPEKLSVQTQKLKQPIITRGGIYFHHFGDDVWKITLNGQTGYSMMKQIEKLEEVYYYSGAMLKYTNISASTLRTTEIQDNTVTADNSSITTAGLLNDLYNSGSTGKVLAETIGTLTNGLGITSYNQDNSSGLTPYEQGTGTNCITKILQSADSLANTLGDCQSDIMKATIKATGGTNVGTFTGMIKNNITNNISNAFNCLSSANLSQAMVATAMCAINGGTGSNCQSVGSNLMGSLTNATNTTLSMLLGNYSAIGGMEANVSLPNGASVGNFYKLNNICVDDLTSIVNSVTDFTNKHTLSYNDIANRLGALSTDLTDLYRPRMVFIYFDDRVYIGHFDSFNWDKNADSLSIQYQLSFTAVRQIVIGRNKINTESSTTSLKNLVIGSGIDALFGGKKSNNSQQASQSIPTINPATVIMH